MRPLKEKVSITLDGDVIMRIRELAEEDDRSFSQFINLTLKRYIAYVDGISSRQPWADKEAQSRND